MSDLTIRFGEGRGIVVPLEVQCRQEEISLEDLHALLFALRVQVLAVDEHADGERVIQRILVCEFDGGPLRHQRRRAILGKLNTSLSSVLMRKTGTTGPGIAATTRAPGAARHAA